VRPLAPPPAWTLVTPYCKRTRPGRRTNTKAAGFPPLSRPSPAAFLPPFAFGLAPTHLDWSTRRHFTRRPRDPPVSKHRQFHTELSSFLASSPANSRPSLAQICVMNLFPMLWASARISTISDIEILKVGLLSVLA
jgi:hypothetical protein